MTPPAIQPHPPAAAPALRQSLWLAVLAVGVLVAVITNFVLPADHGALDWLYLGTSLGAAVAVVGGVIIWGPPTPVARGWLVIAVGTLFYFAGEALWVWYSRNDLDPYPSPADALFLVGVAFLILGLMMLVATRRTVVDRAVQLDTAIVSVSIGAVLWNTSVAPYAIDSEATLLEQSIAAAYPLLDVVLAAVIARQLLAGGRIPTGFILPLLGISVWTVSDVLYYPQELNGTYVEWGWLDFGWMLGFVLVGAGALHPAARRIAETPESSSQLGPSRAVILAVFAALPLMTMTFAEPLGIEPNWTVISGASGLLIALFVARTWSLMAVHHQVGELRGQAHLTSLIRNSSDAIVIIDSSDRIRYASPALSGSWGWASRGLIGRSITELIDPSVHDEYVRWIADLDAATPMKPLESRWLDATGSSRAVSMIVSDLRHDEDIDGIVLTGRDISHRIELENRLRHDARHDPLTGLVNRTAFAEALESVGVSGRTAVLFIDVDDFKDINDALGHDVGDAVLVDLARRLEQCVRDHDTVARLGGDEFGVIIRRADSSSFAAIAERFVRAANAPMDAHGHQLQISLSVGYYDFVEGDDAVDALRRADMAMYEAKRNGKGRVSTFNDALLRSAEQRLDLRSRLTGAVERDEMFLAYQDIVRVSDGVVTGREALLRWAPTDRDPITPDVFISMAEETGDIVAIGAWVLETACRAAVGWSPTEADASPVVSVNVSAVQLDHDMASTVSQVLARTGLAPDRLQLELTESVMAKPDAAIAFQALRDLGVRLAIDDFGTGYCSLAYLKQFDVDTIKIDRAFIDGAHADSRLLAGIAGLISAIGSTAVAEGVETAADRDALVQLGIARAQGYLWGRPTPEVADRGHHHDLAAIERTRS